VTEERVGVVVSKRGYMYFLEEKTNGWIKRSIYPLSIDSITQVRRRASALHSAVSRRARHGRAWPDQPVELAHRVLGGRAGHDEGALLRNARARIPVLSYLDLLLFNRRRTNSNLSAKCF